MGRVVVCEKSCGRRKICRAFSWVTGKNRDGVQANASLRDGELQITAVCICDNGG